MPSISDYLAKQLFIDKNVVTYRSLSRQFNIHVNSAKNELATYHTNPQSSAERCYATYMLSGELLPPQSPPPSQMLISQDENGMDVDQPTQSGSSVDELVAPDSDPVPQVKMLLVGEKDLEHAKTGYARIYSEHVYCLSPSPLVDAGLICGPSPNIYAADAKLSSEQSILLGRVVSADVHIGKVQNVTGAKGKAALASSSKKPGLVSTASSSKIKEEPKAKIKKEETSTKPIKSEETKSTPPAAKPKTTGKLDWSKAKPREKETVKVEKEKPKETKAAPVEVKESKPGVKIGPPSRSKKVAAESSNTSVNKKPPKPASTSSAASGSNSEPPKRGIKRKSALPVDSDSDNVEVSGPSRSVSPPTKLKGKAQSSEVKIKKKIIISDDEDEDDAPKYRVQTKRVSKPIDRSLQAMMDEDDDHVIKHSRKATSPPPSSDGENTEPADDDDAQMVEEEEETKPVPKKKKVKKLIPVGHNGLKKRRVVKSRMTTDAKGYMVTEDYSEYESVDEEEPEGETKSKAKKPVPKGKKISLSDVKPSKTLTKSKSSSSLSKPKKGTGGLMDFFGKK